MIENKEQYVTTVEKEGTIVNVYSSLALSNIPSCNIGESQRPLIVSV